ncbi:MAG TPA: cell division protein FtsL [Geobacteraceae bacterium]|nr:cell division protein FtsL [Geobacteraceae bacterium]
MLTARTTFSKAATPKKLELAVSQRWDLFPYLIIFTILLMLVSLFHVWSRVRVVDLGLQITEASRTMKECQQEKSRLRLEVASLKNPARIELVAKQDLGMALPTDQQVIVIK